MGSLIDLPTVMNDCREAVEQIVPHLEVSADQAVWDKVLEKFNAGKKQKIATLSNDKKAVVISNNKNQNIFISGQELPFAVAVVPYYRALNAYNNELNRFAKLLGFDSRTSGKGKQYFSSLPTKSWDSLYVNRYGTEDPNQVINDMFSDTQDRENFKKFLSDPLWSGIAAEKGGGGRHFDRSTDWMNSGLLKTGNWVAAAASGRDKVVRALYEVSDLTDAIQIQDDVEVAGHFEFGEDQVELNYDKATGAKNYLYYGAPGTGKTYSINKRMREKNYLFIRTVFHSDMQNSDFVGTLKPIQGDNDISYGFSPGPFAKALVTAHKNPSRKICLIIEELNRAPAASVFGELFLLLDRDETGASEYDVDFPSDEFKYWFQQQTGMDNIKIRHPSKLWIAATMNSADQGVFPLDTAFRRRWEQIFKRLNYAGGPEGLVTVINAEGVSKAIAWQYFVRQLNETLIEDCDQQEDRLVGPWFHKNFNDDTGIVIPGKVLIYLWDDILRHQGREAIFDSTIKSYGELSGKLKSGERIFSKSFLKRLFPEEN